MRKKDKTANYQKTNKNEFEDVPKILKENTNVRKKGAKNHMGLKDLYTSTLD
jgi:hypothetical protein